MEASDRWKELAAQALRNAYAAMDPHTKAVLLAIAEEYRTLGERADSQVGSGKGGVAVPGPEHKKSQEDDGRSSWDARSGAPALLRGADTDQP